jgi:hypothetical protein
MRMMRYHIDIDRVNPHLHLGDLFDDMHRCVCDGPRNDY